VFCVLFFNLAGNMK